MTENKQKQTKITFRYKVITKQSIRRNKPWVGACAHARCWDLIGGVARGGNGA